VFLLDSLLQDHSENPHSCLVKLFMNAVAEVEHEDVAASKPNMEIVSRYPRIQNMIRADPLGVGMLATMALGPFAKMSRRPSPSEYARSVLDVPFADRLAGTQRRLSSASTPIYRE
jgi:hypothetical protein